MLAVHHTGTSAGAVGQGACTWPLQAADWLPHSMAGEFQGQVSQESQVDVRGIFMIRRQKSYPIACAHN